MPFISERELSCLRTRVEVAERTVMELDLKHQENYLDCLDTWGAFSREVYQNIQNAKEGLSECTCGSVRRVAVMTGTAQVKSFWRAAVMNVRSVVRRFKLFYLRGRSEYERKVHM